MRILLIEDDAETVGWIADGLAEHGHVVVRAADGVVAIAAMHQARIELSDNHPGLRVRGLLA